MRIFVTGATGFLGNNLVRLLLEQGHEITAAKRISSDLKSLDGLDLEAIDVNLNDSSEVSLHLKEADLVIHSAAMIQLGWSQTEPPKPPCSYVVSKREAEEAFASEVAQGLDGVSVLPGFMVGPWDWRPSSGEMMMAIYKNWVPFAPAGGCSVADVRDVAAGIISAIEHGRAGQKYILGGENLTYLDLWQRMATVMQRPKPKLQLPDWLAETAGRFGDLASKFLKEETQVNTGATRMGQVRHWVDSSLARKELGYQTQSIDTALEDAWNWFKAYDYV